MGGTSLTTGGQADQSKEAGQARRVRNPESTKINTTWSLRTDRKGLPRSPPISLCTWHLKCSSSDGRVCPQWGRPRFDPWVRKVPWRRKGQPTLVFLPGKSHGQRSLVGYTPQGRKELDVTEQLTHTHKHFKKLKMLFLRRLSPWLKLHEQKNLNTANYWAI